jgi:hypothetical protein
MTLLMRMTMIDCTTANKRSSLCYKSRSRLSNCRVGCNEVTQWYTPTIRVRQTCINRLMTSHVMNVFQIQKWVNNVPCRYEGNGLLFLRACYSPSRQPRLFTVQHYDVKMRKSLRAYCQTVERITPRIRSLINTVVTKICQYPCINLMKELRLHPKASHTIIIERTTKPVSIYYGFSSTCETIYQSA